MVPIPFPAGRAVTASPSGPLKAAESPLGGFRIVRAPQRRSRAGSSHWSRWGSRDAARWPVAATVAPGPATRSADGLVPALSRCSDFAQPASPFSRRRTRDCWLPSVRAARVLDTNDTRSNACDIQSKHGGRTLSDAGRLCGAILGLSGGTNVEMHQVRYFLALCEEKQFTRAALRCGVAQQSLTNAIRALETELGGTLFHRTRTVKLTDLGQSVKPYLRQIARSAERAQREAARLRPVTTNSENAFRPSRSDAIW